jgi:hypothetical protein
MVSGIFEWSVLPALESQSGPFPTLQKRCLQNVAVCDRLQVSSLRKAFSKLDEWAKGKT